MSSSLVSDQEESKTTAASAPQEPSPYARRARLYSLLIYCIARLIYATLRLHKENYERLIPNHPRQESDTNNDSNSEEDKSEEDGRDSKLTGEDSNDQIETGNAVRRRKQAGVIMVTWHGRTLIPANLLRNRGYWALISLSRDGEMQNQIFQRFGFQTIRGSTGRGGVRGALQMARKVREGGILAFTPDGPRGPTHKVQLGVILMAEKSGAPIVPVGISASGRWLVRSWDQYMIPQPFARAYFLVGEPIYVAPRLDEAGREAVAEQVEIAVNRLEKEAERRAGHLDYPIAWRTE